MLRSGSTAALFERRLVRAILFCSQPAQVQANNVLLLIHRS
jgi:hypothetical protein